MVHSKFTAVLAGLGFLATLSACSAQSDKDKLMEAQFCLDESTAATAQSCVSSIAYMQTSQSYALQCAAGFIESGVTSPANLSQALDSISNNSNSSTALLSALNMGSVSLANNTAEYCAKSGQVGFSLLGAMAKSATSIASAASSLGLGSCSTDLSQCDTSQIEDTITEIQKTINSDPSATMSLADATAAVEAIASSIQTVYTTTCGTTGANQDICDPIKTAIADAGVDITDPNLDLVALGKELLAQWKP
ncbi:hypothetical protein B9G69_017305 [Bdellovibrio sp. SKB1291214]|uniref:hypothetical protein n=1 Tax=Bdellovibrio sp. SKB1291214 TaxID=1732569 RepID=UPI000B51E1E7|nr:hypothetical protein [Bdellovibrio sp. SKB1291214]UYL08803.1 hypothetical protein B9G69_017305 [Bdellovibrio sp. SKB1291214]